MLHGIAAGRCFLWLLLHGAARHGKIFPEKLKMGISSHAWLRRVCEGSSSNMVEPADLRRDYVVTFVYLSAWGEGARQRRTGLSNVFGLAGVPILRPHRTINPNFPQRLPIRIQSLSKGGTLKYRASWSLGCGWNWHAKDWRQRTGPVSWRWQLSRHHWAVGFFNVLKVLKSPGRSRGASFTGSRMVPDGSFFFYNFLIWPSCSLFRCLHLGAQKNPKDVEVAVWRKLCFRCLTCFFICQQHNWRWQAIKVTAPTTKVRGKNRNATSGNYVKKSMTSTSPQPPFLQASQSPSWHYQNCFDKFSARVRGLDYMVLQPRWCRPWIV